MSAIQIIGTTVTTTRANIRQGSPSITAPVLRKVDAGTSVAVIGVATGDTVQGNAQWYHTDEQAYIWSGACGALSAPAASSGDVPNVVDISHGDQVTSFAQARGAGVLGVIHKATTGQSGQDPHYAQNRRDAVAAGLLWGAYHWGTAAPVDKQVQNFLDTAKPDAHTLVALDFETDDGNQMTLDMARAFLQGVQAKLGRRAVLYSGDRIKDQLKNTVDSFFGQHRLWLAQYGSRPQVQPSWNTFWLWQYTDGSDRKPAVIVPGIPGDAQGRLDCNHFMGSEDQLRAQWAS